MFKPYKVILLAVVVSLYASAVFAQKPEATPRKPATDEKAEKLERAEPFNGDVEFPEVEGWELSDKFTYPAKELGYSINYESPEGGRVTVYVFTGGYASIPNELKGPVKAEMDRAIGEINAVTEMGAYESSKKISSGEVTIGTGTETVKALHTRYLIVARGTDLDSDIYVLPYENHIIKVRATRRKADDGEKNEVFDGLMNEIARLFSK